MAQTIREGNFARESREKTRMPTVASQNNLLSGINAPAIRADSRDSRATSYFR